MTLRVLGIDPGLTRCGVGIVDVEPDRTATLVDVVVIRTAPDLALERRLLAIGMGIDDLLDRWEPHAVALERVFAQQNLRTVMGTAQASGVALHAAARRGLAVGLHTPSEVKAAITGYGSADKRQVQQMVARVLETRRRTETRRCRGRTGDRHLSCLAPDGSLRGCGCDARVIGRIHPRADRVARRRACGSGVGRQP